MEKPLDMEGKEEGEGLFCEISIPQRGREIHIVSKKVSPDTLEEIWIPHSVSGFQKPRFQKP